MAVHASRTAPHTPPADAAAPRADVGTLTVAAVGALGPLSPSFRVRVMLYCKELERHGIDLAPYPLFTQAESETFAAAGARTRAAILLRARRRLLSRLERAGNDASVALIQRQADLLPSLRAERVAAGGRRLVWDVDDAIWHDARHAGGHPLAFLKGTRRKVRWLLDRADRVVAANRILAEYLGQYSDNVTVIPSLVETRGLPVRRHGDAGEVVLGWVGSPTTAHYLHKLDGVLRRLPALIPGRRLVLLLVGGRLERVPGLEIHHVPWSVEAERDALARIDIGLMPQPDNEWTRGKSAYKAMQYMAAGIPAIADDVGVAAETVGHGEAGFVVKDDHEWLEAIALLARNPELRANLGAKGRARIERDFSIPRWAPELAAVLSGTTRAEPELAPAGA